MRVLGRFSQQAPLEIDGEILRFAALQHCSPAEVVLFGSGARGELGTTSDLDLLVVLAHGNPADPRDGLTLISGRGSAMSREPTC